MWRCPERWTWRWLAAILAFFFMAQTAAAQVNRGSLSDLAQEKSKQAATEKAAADARAAAEGLPVRQEMDDGNVIELKRFDGDRPIYLITENAVAADTVSTDEVHLGGSLGLALDGSGQTLGIWDGGRVLQTHQELTGRVTNMDIVGFSNHSTHVAGTMIAAGVNAAAKGMSFAASLRGYDFNNDTAEMAGEQLLPNPIMVSNHSYGFISGWIFNFFGNGRWVWFGVPAISTTEDPIFGYYVQDAADWDQIAVDSPNYLMVKSAGNDRGEGPAGTVVHNHIQNGPGVNFTDSHPVDGGASGFDTIGGGSGMAKNILTIGAVNDIPGGWTQPADVVPASFTGWGPTDDGRVKPDLVANGIGLTSSFATCATCYGGFSGTSMSAPNTSGSIGLLHQHVNNLFGVPFRSSTIKALTIHTADEAGANPGPDYANGWGLLNTATAASLVTDHSNLVNSFHIIELTLNDAQTIELDLVSDGTGPFRATLVWTDPAGAVPPFTVDPPNLVLVNDVDLRVIGPSGTSEPWVLDPANPGSAATTGDNFRDNVEQIVIDTPVAGTYTVRINHKGTLAGGGPQVVSLIVTGNQDVPPPVCGNGAIEGSEQCDDPDFGGATCVSLGFDAGTLACSNACTLDTSGCLLCNGGGTSGRWNLPDATHLGTVFGQLKDPLGTTIYTVSASLVQTSLSGGIITGIIYDGSSPAPFYIDGEWNFTDPSHGKFGSKIFEFGTGNSVGAIEGEWKDDPLFSIGGQFKGDWKICQ